MDLIKRKKLDEAKESIKTLIKKATLGNQLAEVMGAFDTSGSMSQLYANGNVQTIFERAFPICMAFDDDGVMPVYEFSNKVKRIPADVTINNLEGFVRRYTKPDYQGTDYSPAINRIVEDYKASRGPKPGIISKWFGAKDSDPKPVLPVYVLFITDGECNVSDKAAAEKAIRQASELPIFWQFVGLSTHYSTDFEFLKTLDTMVGRKIDNANFAEISLSKFEGSSDEWLYDLLLAEFPDYIKKALDLDMID